MTKSGSSSYAVSSIVLALLILLPGCPMSSTSQHRSYLLSQGITPDNVAQISEGARTGLSYNEYRPVLDYLKRVHPELPNGQLPTGLTLRTIIESHRDFEASGPGQAVGSESTTSAESNSVEAAKAETPPSPPPTARPAASSAQSFRTPASSAQAAPEQAATVRSDVPAPPPMPATEVVLPD